MSEQFAFQLAAFVCKKLTRCPETRKDMNHQSTSYRRSRVIMQWDSLGPLAKMINDREDVLVLPR